MNFNLYLYGNPEGNYSQIPDDYLASEVGAFQKDLKGSRLVIMRKMDLMHYLYWERMSENRYIGIGLIFNRAYVSHPKQLVALFKDLIEDYLIKKGDIIRYTKEGELRYVLKSFGENPLRRQKLHELIAEKFDNASAQYGIMPLKSTYNGEHTARVINYATDEKQIVAMAASYNTLIVDDSAGVEQGYIPQIIDGLKASIDELNEQNTNLQQQAIILTRQKKQMRWILMLLSLLLIGGVVFYYYAQNKKQVIQTKSDEISHLNSVVDDKNDYITSLEDDIWYLRQDSANLSHNLREKTNQYNEVKQKLSDLNYELNYNMTNAYQYFDSWRSTNYHQPSSTSSKTYTIVANKGDELRITYYVSSESGCDKLYVSCKRNGYSSQDMFSPKSGVDSGTYTYVFPYADTYQITVKYTKDGSVDSDYDNAGISSIYLYRPIISKLRNMSQY